MTARYRTYTCEGLVETLVKRRWPFKTKENYIDIPFWGNRVLEVAHILIESYSIKHYLCEIHICTYILYHFVPVHICVYTIYIYINIKYVYHSCVHCSFYSVLILTSDMMAAMILFHANVLP